MANVGKRQPCWSNANRAVMVKQGSPVSPYDSKQSLRHGKPRRRRSSSQIPSRAIVNMRAAVRKPFEQASRRGVYLRGNGGVPARNVVLVFPPVCGRTSLRYGLFYILAWSVLARKKRCTSAVRRCTCAEETVYLRGKRGVPARKKWCTCAVKGVYLRGNLVTSTCSFAGLSCRSSGSPCNVVVVLFLLLFNNRETGRSLHTAIVGIGRLPVGEYGIGESHG